MSPVLIILAFLILLAYAWYVLRLTPLHEEKTNNEKITQVSIVVAFKNEIKNLHQLINSLKSQSINHENFEVILVDDNSTDGSYELAKELSEGSIDVQVLKNLYSGKKRAIQTGVHAAKHNWIVQTDADVILPRNWVESISKSITSEIDFIAAPLRVKTSNNRMVERFLAMENLALQQLTYSSIETGKPLMCNGANMAYRKSVYLANENNLRFDIPSGDDTFLLIETWKSKPNRITYLTNREAIVDTQAADSYQDAVIQHTRWAKKVSAYSGTKHIQTTGWLLLTAHFLVLILFFGGLTFKEIHYFFIYWIIKSLIDIRFTKNIQRFFNQKMDATSVLSFNLFYPVFLIEVFIRSIIKKGA